MQYFPNVTRHRYLLPLPDEAVEGGPWSMFSSEETIGVILTRCVKQAAVTLQEPEEEITPVPAIVKAIRKLPIQTKDSGVPSVEQLTEKEAPPVLLHTDSNHTQ